ncbi:hypothetical protein H6F88_12605 [Oculatella sp. FACHB-28]|uniref:hypothetical protein n=1 Tax=Cyanophyceae TaxID=3028117 RepID=UPI00168900F9|nr:hypothetical protein [Oculatella sp. FACHB-28]MBD2068321.1 hypothetical protein [Leptolyngbya sp. FACHB-671]
MTTWTGCSNRQITRHEQEIYDHLLHWIELEPPDRLIKRFRCLFIDGTGYPDADIAASLDAVTASGLASEEFRYVLNRCCHILINRWQARSQFQMAIPELVGLFETIPAEPVTGIKRSRSVRRLRELVKLFTETEQYLTLRRLAQVVQEAENNANAGNRPLGTLIRRYPYLYEHCLLSEDSTQEHQHTVKQIQFRVQRQFEIDLSQYVTYQMRRSQIASRLSSPTAQRIIQPVANPTLLNDQELGRAIRHYIGKVEGSSTYRDLAYSFLAHSGQAVTYKTFKDDLYQYMTSSVDPEYGRRKFNNQLYQHLKSTLPDSNSKPLDDFLVVRTCSQLLNFLVVESPQRPQHFVFVDLLTNLGPVLTTGLLLKIVLLCRKVKPSLERRFSILFSHYEAYTRDAVAWLVKALENLNVALSTHFGAVDLSFVC